MSYRLRFDRRFMSHLEALPGDARSMARQQIKALANNPRPVRAKELDEHPGYYRLWLPRDPGRKRPRFDPPVLGQLWDYSPVFLLT